MLLPHLPITFQRGGSLITLNPGKVDRLHEVHYRKDAFGGNLSAVDGCHVSRGFVHDVRRWPLAASGDLANKISDALSFDGPADTSAFPVTNIPAITDPNDLPFLLSH